MARKPKPLSQKKSMLGGWACALLVEHYFWVIHNKGHHSYHTCDTFFEPLEGVKVKSAFFLI